MSKIKNKNNTQNEDYLQPQDILILKSFNK